MTFTIYPAIDLKAGNCVRLTRGDMASATTYSDDPGKTATEFEALGATWLHMVDLDGAFAGQSANGEAVETVLSKTNLPIQLGGGLRKMVHVEAWLDKGVKRVILGTAALKDPDFVIDACRAFPGKIAVGVDARAGFVATEGWAETSEVTVTELAKRFEGVGVCALIHTDIDRDGTLTGMNISASAELARSVSIPVIGSGGLAGIDDVVRAKATGLLNGVITGKALYDGRLDLGDALDVARDRTVVESKPSC